MRFTEDTVERATLEWLTQIGYTYIFGGDIAPGETAAEQNNYHEELHMRVTDSRNKMDRGNN